jgi:hypothetical protein
MTYLTSPSPPKFSLYFVSKYFPGVPYRKPETVLSKKSAGRNEKDIAEINGTELEESRNKQRNVTLETDATINSWYTNMAALSKVTLATIVPSIAI